jgi:hypothetical protein
MKSTRMCGRAGGPVVVLSFVVGCGAGHLASPDAAPSPSPDAAPAPDAALPRAPGRVDILFMIDNSSETTEMQQQLEMQLPLFVSALESLPGGLPDLHIAVVSSDMGAPGDSTPQLGCTAAGDQGIFRGWPDTGCGTTPGLAPGDTFISSAGSVANYTGKLADVLSCMVQLGSAGCGFEHQLAAVVRALGADGQGPPPANVGFLRADAELAIFVLTNEDDCSAPPDTTLYSLNGGQQSVSNPLGPIGNYRCNQFGHLCKDPTGPQPDAWLPPPLLPPSDATGDPIELTLTDCISDDGGGGMLTPVSTFISQIKALKHDPSQVVVGAIAAPVTPYTVMWSPPPSPSVATASELWPSVMHSCGSPEGYGTSPAATQKTTDGSFGDPAVRVAQWVQAFGDNGVLGSVCDSNFAATMQTFASKIGQHLPLALKVRRATE